MPGDRMHTIPTVADFEYLVQRLARDYYVEGMDRDDLAQEARIGVWEAIKAHRSERGRSLRNLAAMFARRRLVDALKYSQAMKRQGEQPDLRLDVPVSAETPDLTLAEVIPLHDDPGERLSNAGELRSLIDGMRTDLSEIEMSAIVLKASGRSYKEAAAMLGETEKTIDNALWRARRKLAPYNPDLAAA